MCRSKAAGGRRCACGQDRTQINARRRAVYAAARAAGADSDLDRPPACPPASPDLPDLPWQQAQARVGEISDQLAAMDTTEAWGQRNPDGTFTPTPEGQRGEQLLREAGGLVTAEADRRAAGELAVIDADERAALGGASREEFVAAVAAEYQGLEQRFQDVADQLDHHLESTSPSAPGGVEEGAALLAEAAALQADMDVAAELLTTFMRGEDQWALRRNAARAAATAEALSDLRELGHPDPIGLFHPASNPAALPAVAEACTVFPRDWLDRSTKGLPLYVDGTSGRAEFIPEVTTPIVPGGPSQTVAAVLISGRSPVPGKPVGFADAVHELTHRMEVEGAPGLLGAELAFLHRRTVNPHTGQQEALQSYLGQPDEWVRPDGFTDMYVGKHYAHGNGAEVASTGVEALFAGAFGGLRGEALAHQADEDHRRFVLGCLATL